MNLAKVIDTMKTNKKVYYSATEKLFENEQALEEKSTLNFIIVAVIIAGGVALLVFMCTVRRNIHPLHRALALTSTLPVARAYDFQMHCDQFDKIHVRVPSFTVYVWFFVLVALTIWKLALAESA